MNPWLCSASWYTTPLLRKIKPEIVAGVVTQVDETLDEHLVHVLPGHLQVFCADQGQAGGPGIKLTRETGSTSCAKVAGGPGFTFSRYPKAPR